LDRQNLFCFGLGYCAEHFVARFGEKFDRVTGTVRDADKATRLMRIGAVPVDAMTFAGSGASAEMAARLATADCVLVSVPPDDDGDPVLRHFAEALAGASRLHTLVYLSTIGVYGDHGGAWIDESTEPMPVSGRSRARLEAERAWSALAARSGKTLVILRLAGIYGPGRNALRQVAAGSARRIVKPGQVFNRIHVADIAAIIDAAFTRRAAGVFNVADDEPTAPGVPIAFAADLLGLAPPPEVPFVEASRDMSEMARSFFAESKRARNERVKRDLGANLAYPSYREGLRALFAAGEGVTRP
jgi:nucleoside-diphosphate-sugar epimerase